MWVWSVAHADARRGMDGNNTFTVNQERWPSLAADKGSQPARITNTTRTEESASRFDNLTPLSGPFPSNQMPSAHSVTGLITSSKNHS